MFEVEKINFETMGSLVDDFCLQNKVEGNINNSSQEHMKVGKFEQEHWWGFFTEGKLISISGCHKSNDFGVGGWRLLFRSATLNGYKSLAGTFSRDLNHDFCFGHILKIQKKMATDNGANYMFFTTNADESGTLGSQKVDKFVEKILLPMGKVSVLKKNYTYFYCKQNIWKVL